MFGKLKKLSRSVFVVAALGAVSASAAQAGDFTVGTAGIGGFSIITAQTDVINEMKVPNGIWRCTTIKYSEATVKDGSTTVEAHPEYSGCKSFGVTATVSTTGCNYVFHTTAAAGGCSELGRQLQSGKRNDSDGSRTHVHRSYWVADGSYGTYLRQYGQCDDGERRPDIDN
jgi:hypothetical protein